MKIQTWFKLRVGAVSVLALLGAQAASAACSGNTCNTLQDQPVVLSLSDVNAPSVFEHASVSQGTVGSRVERYGVPMDSPSSLCGTNSALLYSADFSGGGVQWRPASGNSQSNQNGTPEVTFSFCNGSTLLRSTVMSMTVADVNNAPQINGNLIVNGNFAVPLPDPAKPEEIPYWTLTGVDTAGDSLVSYAYGGLAFNAGNRPPNGTAFQTFATAAGEIYTGKLRTTYGGQPDDNQRIRVQFIDSASPNAPPLFDQVYGQSKEGSISFKAIGANTIVRISDISTTTDSTDIALSEITITGPLLPQTTLEDTSLLMSTLQPLNVSDPDVPSNVGSDPGAPSSLYHVLTLSVSHGTLTVGALPVPIASWDHSADDPRATVTGSGSTITVTGNLAGINYLLRGLTYTPTANYNGLDVLAMLLDDQGNVGQGPNAEPAPFPLKTPANIQINVVSVNDPPSGQDGSATTRLNAPYTFKLSDFSTGLTDAADTPPNAFDGIVVTGLPAKGVLAVSGTNVTPNQALTLADLLNMTWTPPAGESGPSLTSFPFKVRDDGGTDNGGIPLAVNANVMMLNVIPNVNVPPVANTDGYTTPHATGILLTPLSNDTDPDNDVLRITSINGVPLTPTVAQTIAVANGTITVDTNGAIRFTPDATFTGLVSFPYAIADGFGGTANSKITIQVDAKPNTPPVANTDPYATSIGVPISLTPLANDTDADGDSLQITSINGTTITTGTAQTIAVPNGSVTVSATGEITFTPAAQYTGTVSFPYSISDGHFFFFFVMSIVVSAIAVVPRDSSFTPVPTLGEWALILLSTLLAGVAAMALRRKRAG